MSGRSKFKTSKRGANVSPPSRFARYHAVPEVDELLRAEADRPDPKTQFVFDSSNSIVSKNESPDVGFRYSVNPYRGCEHGCPYCYARPLHEYLGWSAGLDFETKILVKADAPALLRRWLSRPGWKAEPIAFSGATDCYQPAERRFELTRQCLQVVLEARQPVYVVTKNALLLRDLDLLSELARRRLVHVSISLTTLDPQLAGQLEPRSSRPHARLRTLAILAEHGIPTQALIAPIIPGLNDHEVPRLLKAAAEAGAMSASHTLLRLPPSVQPVFLDWLDRNLPTQRRKIEKLIRATHGGELDDPRFGFRMCGTGTLASQIRKTFEVFRARYGLDHSLPAVDTSQFRRPDPRQKSLFDSTSVPHQFGR